MSPSSVRRMFAISFWYGGEQCISKDRITGYSEMPRYVFGSSPRSTRAGNEQRSIARATSRNLMCVVSVWPW